MLTWFVQMSLKSNFRKIPLEERQAMSKRQLDKHSDWCPIVVEPRDDNQPKLKGGCKFLFQRDVTMGSVLTIIRKRMDALTAEEALWVFVWSIQKGEPPAAVLAENPRTVGEYYDAYKADDGFMLVQYSKENTFGSK